MAYKKMKNPLVISTVLEKEQHENLKLFSFIEKRPMAEIMREVIQMLIKEKEKIHPEIKNF